MFVSDTDSIDVTLPNPELIKKEPENNDMFDVVVVGAGPAGMSAAICASRADLKTLVIEKALPGGECSTACKIDNFIGQPNGIHGPELSRVMEAQLFNQEIFYTCETVIDFINFDGPVKTVTTSLGNSYRTKTIIFGTWSRTQKIRIRF